MIDDTHYMEEPTQMELDGYVVELVEILKREVSCYNTVRDLLVLEQQALIGNDMTSLDDILGKQEDLFSSIACLEKSRMEVLAKIGAVVGEDPGSITLSRLREMVGVQLKRLLTETGHVLEAIYDDIRDRKNANAMLIRQGILMVESNMRVIYEAVGASGKSKNVYSHGARDERPAGGIRIDGRM